MEIMAAAGQPPKVALDRRWLWLFGGSGLLLAGLVGLIVFLALRAASGPAEPAEVAARIAVPEEPLFSYVKMPAREATILATLKKSGLPTLEGKWYFLGPFDNSNHQGFRAVYPPEREIDLYKSYPGKGGQIASWKEFPDFAPGRIVDLRKFPQNDDSCVYLFHLIEVRQPVDLPLSLGSDDTLTVWLNGKKLLEHEVYRGAAPDQEFVTLPLRSGRNELLVKVCNGTGDWAFYVLPQFPPNLEKLFGKRLLQDFPKPGR
jgi:hypothetical protein